MLNAQVRLLALADLREVARNRWTIVAALGFALVSASLTLAASAGGSEGFGPAAAGLINIELITVPLFALIVGALAFVRDRERGTHAYMRALPITLRELYVSKWITVAAQVSAVVLAGFAGAFAAMSLAGVSGGDVGGAVQFAALTWLLAIACAAIGIGISTAVSRSPTALGAAIAAWLLLVIFGDLGVMATALVTRMNVSVLLALTSVNPAEAYKIASVAALSGSVDVLGAGGRLAADTFGAGVMPIMVAVLLAWTLAALFAGWRFLSRRSDA